MYIKIINNIYNKWKRIDSNNKKKNRENKIILMMKKI